ncbi:small integral membrane protein 8 isoform X2 [Pseudopipra pipra]|uniref:small integral membrane protein 8 isoform X2 n=1 Tax=Pseudopipra pipra TaxID=415032 RepID=UPI0031399756
MRRRSPARPAPRGGAVGGARKYSILTNMSSTKPSNENETPGERKPGLRSVQTTMLFRAVNPELFIKPNKPVMAFGLITISLCVAYLGYLHATAENKKDLYEAIDSEGARYMRRKTSKWD